MAERVVCPVRRAARARPGDVALRGDAVIWTWRDCDAAVDGLCMALRRAGAGRGDRIAGLAANSPAYVALVFAALRLGAVLAPLNLRRGEAHWRKALDRLDPALVCVDAAHRGAAAGRATLALDAPTGAAEPADAALDPDREAAVVFTSGSGGAPKGVVLTVGNLLAGAAASNALLPLQPGDGWLLDLPLYHVGGLAIPFRAALAGCAVVVRDGFAPDATLARLESGEVTVLSCVPGMLRDLLAADPGAHVLARVRAILLGGGPLDTGLLDEARRLAVPVRPTYGLTEAASQVHTDGKHLPGMELRVIDGEIAVRGPAVFARYLDDETPARDAEGWFRTGDLGRLHADGRLEVLGRRDETYVSGGENIHPAEIEEVARGFPGLADCAAVGTPSRRFGRRPVLFAAPQDLDAAALQTWLGERLPKLLVPDAVITVAELPRLALDKVDRAALLAAWLADQDPAS
jgi:O-succinylbenzoic acid--CoA ligase